MDSPKAVESEDCNPWNDDIIMKIYNESISSHTLKGKKYKKFKSCVDDLGNIPVGEPGPWQQVSVSETLNSVQSTDINIKISDILTESSMGKDVNPVDTPTVIEDSSSQQLHTLDTLQKQMLNSWYESGYLTGRYYALREAYQGIPPPENIHKLT